MKVAARVLYGSQNFYLDGPNSDYDYKLLMVPDFNELYSYHRVDKNDLPYFYDPEHYSVMSVMKFDENVRKGNVNALEMVFSREIVCYDNELSTYFDVASQAFADGYLEKVWPDFLRTARGMMMNSFDRYGVTRKTASRAMYLLCFAKYVAEHEFKVTTETWKYADVVSKPYALRFEDAPLPNIDEFIQQMDALEQNVTPDFTFTYDWNAQLEATMKDYVYKHVKESYYAPV